MSHKKMKFLDYEKLGVISEALATREVGDKVLMGRVEAYSCESSVGFYIIYVCVRVFFVGL